MKSITTVAAVVLLIVASFWYETMVWNECLQTNSWFYCMRVLSK